MNKKQAFDLLQIKGKTATKKLIKLQFKKLSKKYHPDLNKDDSVFSNLFKLLKEAYNYLEKIPNDVVFLDDKVQVKKIEKLRPRQNKRLFFYIISCYVCNNDIKLTKEEFTKYKKYKSSHYYCDVCVSDKKWILEWRNVKNILLIFVIIILPTILITFLSFSLLLKLRVQIFIPIWISIMSFLVCFLIFEIVKEKFNKN